MLNKIIAAVGAEFVPVDLDHTGLAVALGACKDLISALRLLAERKARQLERRKFLQKVVTLEDLLGGTPAQAARERLDDGSTIQEALDRLSRMRKANPGPRMIHGSPKPTAPPH
jgi:hypothetical protein